MSVEKAIWSAYLENPCRLYNIRELSLHLKKSYPLIHQHVSRLLLNRHLVSKTLGKSILCYPNYQDSYTLLSLALAEEKFLRDQIVVQPHLATLRDYFSSQIFPGVLSVFLANDDVVIILASKNDQRAVENSLSQTTLNKKIHYIIFNEVSSNVNLLLNKSLVLFGFEQFHSLIRLNYELYASKHNVVRLHD